MAYVSHLGLALILGLTQTAFNLKFHRGDQGYRLQDNMDDLDDLYGIPPHLPSDFLEETDRGRTSNLHINQNDDRSVKQLLKALNFSLFDPESTHRRKKSQSNERANFFDNYRSYDEIQNFLERQAAVCGCRCQLFSIGQSFERREMNIIKISSSCAEEPKRRIWIDAGIHAREWIAPSTALWFVDQLVNTYTSDPVTRRILEAYDWFILPVVNPDGYVYSMTGHRMWRTTRSQHPGSNSRCHGCDANRNFDYQWNTTGVSSHPCGETYPGIYAASEPEVAAISGFVGNNSAMFDFFITLHSYGQLWMLPYGYSNKLPDNYENMMRAGMAGAEALARVYGTRYTVGAASSILYESSGTSRDWAAGVAKIPYVYTLELRDTGTYAFMLPPNQIIPTGVETWAGIQAMAAHVLDNDPAEGRHEAGL